MARIEWQEIAGVEHVRSLKQGTVITFGNVSEFSIRNAMLTPAVIDEIERRCPMGLEHVQMDGTHRWIAEVWNGDANSLRRERARRNAREEARMEALVNAE